MIPNAWEGYPIFQGLLHQVKPLMRSPFMSVSSCRSWEPPGPGEGFSDRRCVQYIP